MQQSIELINRKQVAALLKVHPNRLGALIRRGLIPEPRYLSARRPRWMRRDVESALERIAGGTAPGTD